MHFQIFLPHQTEVAGAETLAAAGLAGLAENFDVRVSEGPEVRKGALFAWLSPGQGQWGYRPVDQEWIPAAADGDLERGRYWVGLWNDNLPQPKDLARTYQQPGVELELGDGHNWLIPRASELPRDIILLDDGSLKFEPQRQFHAFYVEADRWKNVLAESDEETMAEYQDLWQFALRALAVNYRMTPEVASALGLFSTTNVQRPMYAVVGALDGR